MGALQRAWSWRPVTAALVPVVVCILHVAQAERSMCSPGAFMCKTGQQCIKKGERCNQIFDCADMSDEEGCEGICLPGHFLCSDGKCIDEGKRCDQVKDCSDDEIHCVACPRNKFQCADQTCLPARMRCNGYRECRDGSDEENCKENEKTEMELEGKTLYRSDVSTTNETDTENTGCSILPYSSVNLYFVIINFYFLARLFQMCP